jgi:hypothetical protein
MTTFRVSEYFGKRKRIGRRKSNVARAWYKKKNVDPDTDSCRQRKVLATPAEIDNGKQRKKTGNQKEASKDPNTGGEAANALR